MEEKKHEQTADHIVDQDDIASKISRTDWHEKHYSLLNILVGTDKGVKNWEFHKEHYFFNRVKFADGLILAGSHDWKSDVQKSDNPIVKGFFRYVNYLEIKGPEDNLTIDDIHHAMTGTMMALEEFFQKNGVCPDELTTTFIVTRKPFKILKYLEDMKEKMHVKINDRTAGIWRIRGYGCFPIQIIATPYLKNRNLKYMKALTKMSSKKEREEVLKQIEKFEESYPVEVADITDGFRKLNAREISEEGGNMEAIMKGLFPEEYKEFELYKSNLEQANGNLEQANQNLTQANRDLITQQVQTVCKLKAKGFSDDEILETVGIDRKTLLDYLAKAE